MFKRLVIVVVGVLVLVLAIGSVKYMQFKGMQAMFSKPQPPAVIASAEVKAEQWQPTLRAVGSLVAMHGIDVTTEVAGLVDKIQFESGQPVKAGDVLLQLNDSLDRATLEGLKANRKLAKVQFDRAAELLPKRAVSQSSYDEAKANYDVAQANVVTQETATAKKTIRAPFSGVLGLRKVDPGDFLSPGTAIVSLRTLDPIYVDYALPERDYPSLKPGMTVEISTGAYPGQVFKGELTAMEPGVDVGTRSVKLRATLANADGRLRPGMFVEVRTLQPQQEAVLTIPQTAVSFNTYGDFVYVITKGEGGAMVAKRRQIETGAEREGRVVVTKGLQAGDQVVRSGTNKLRDGQPVAIDNSVQLNDAEVTKE